MLNEDLLAFLQPAPSYLHPSEWRDVCGCCSDIRVTDRTFTLRLMLPRGTYRCRIEMLPGSFDMRTAMMVATEVPSGKKVLLGADGPGPRAQRHGGADGENLCQRQIERRTVVRPAGA